LHLLAELLQSEEGRWESVDAQFGFPSDSRS
jgi:hypothetical protein